MIKYPVQQQEPEHIELLSIGYSPISHPTEFTPAQAVGIGVAATPTFIKKFGNNLQLREKAIQMIEDWEKRNSWHMGGARACIHEFRLFRSGKMDEGKVCVIHYRQTETFAFCLFEEEFSFMQQAE